ncbi:MAG: response regulator, partial [Gammaproteobacteria bacterium]
MSSPARVVALLDRLPLRTLRAKFLAINVPLVVLFTVALFVLFEVTAYRNGLHRLHEKLEKIVTSQGAALSEPVWNLDTAQVKLIIAAMDNEPDLAGAVVTDESGDLLASIGAVTGTRQDLVATRNITFTRDGRSIVIGELSIALSREPLLVAFKRRALLEGALLGVLVLAVVISALIANRRTIGIPLERMLESIETTEKGGDRKPADWRSEDEIGTVVSAFNDMQRRQQSYEQELRNARDTLERRVAERTHDLEQALEELRDSEARLMTMIDETPMAMSLVADKTFVYANRRFYEMFRTSEAEATGKSSDDYFADPEEAERIAGQLRQRRAIRDRECHCRRSDGTTFWALVSVHPFEYQGEPAWLASLIDISERRQAEQALAENTAVLKATLENMDQGIFMVDSDRRLVAYNKRVCELLDLPDEFLATRPTSEEIAHRQLDQGAYRRTNGDAQAQIRHWPEPLESSRESYTHEHERPDGMILEVRNTPLAGGGWVRTFTDITDRARAARELERAMEATQAASRAKSAFVANMSHEIRTPMNAMIGLTELTLETSLTQRQREYLTKAQAASQSLLRIIDDILDFSKIEAGKLDIESVDFELDEVLDRLGTILGLKAAEKGLELVFSVAEAVPASLVGDPFRLEQVLVNLAGNAVKFTERGEIVISADVASSRKDSVQLEFSVQDTGIGLTTKQHARLFEAFTQADESMTRRYGGTGLGLAISKQLVQMMAGKIWAESVQGQGTIVSFTARFGLSEQQSRREHPTSADIRGIRVMVVDDIESSRETFARSLRGFTLNVSTRDSGEAALEELHRAAEQGVPYTLVLMDWRMPGIDGLAATRQIRSDAILAEVPTTVIVVTAHDREQLLAEAEAEGVEFDGILTKPVSPSRLLDKVVEVLGQSEPRSTTRSAKDWSQVRLDGLRVLVVEDQPVNQQIAREILEGAGVEIEVAGNGREAVEQVCSATPLAHFDAVLMDLQMPELDGYEASRIIRRQHTSHELPIIAMTAHAMREERQACVEAGMNDHVSKPIDPARLLAVLQRWVAGGRVVRAGERPTDSANEDPFGLPLRVDGIAIREGVDRLRGNAKLYRQLLASFAAKASEARGCLQAALARADRVAAAKVAHQIKGLAGNVAAHELSTVAGELESVLRSENSIPIDELIERFESALSQALVSIETLGLDECSGFDDKSAPAGDAQILPPQPPSGELAERLQELSGLLNAHDLGAERCFQAIAVAYDLTGCA